MSDTEQPERGRRIWASVLGVLTCIALLASILGVWAARTLFDTDRFSEAVEKSLESEDVVDALSAWVATQVDTAVQAADVGDRILPDDLDPLAPIVDRAVAEVLANQADRFVRSDAAREIIVEVADRAHRAVMRVLDGDLPDTPLVTVDDGTVTVSLLPAVVAVFERIQDLGLLTDVALPELTAEMTPDEQRTALSDALGVDLPDDLGQLTIYSKRLGSVTTTVGAAQRALELIRAALVLLVASTLLLGTLTIVVAPDRRRAVLWLAGGVAVSALIARVVVRRVADSVPELLTDPTARAALHDIVAEVVSNLDRTVTILALLALLLVVVLVATAWFDRNPDQLGRVTDTASDHVELVRAGGVGLAVVVLLVFGLNQLTFVLAVALAVVPFVWTATLPRTEEPDTTASDG